MSLPLPFYSPLTRPACFPCKIITALSTSRNQRTVKRPKLSSWQSRAGCVTQLLLLNNIFLRPAVPILELVVLDKPSTAPCLEDLGSQKLCGSFIIVGGWGGVLTHAVMLQISSPPADSLSVVFTVSWFICTNSCLISGIDEIFTACSLCL